MDNPTRWNITNSAQNIVSALVDPSKQFDNVFRREWGNTFANFSKPQLPKHVPNKKFDTDLKAKLNAYVSNLAKRKQIKAYEAQQAAKSLEGTQLDREICLKIPEIFFKEDFDLSDLDTHNKVISSVRLINESNDGPAQFEPHRSYEGDDDDDANNDEESSSHYNSRQFKNRQQRRLHLEQQMQQFQTNRVQLLTKVQLKELEQRFTDYLDVVEEKLASQISNRSGDFFQVMSSVDSVMDELSLAIKSVTSLRRKCSKMNNNLITPNAKIINLKRTRDNAQIVLDKMNEIAYLYKVQPKLLGSDFANISELVESIANGFNEISERNSLTLSSLLQIQAEKFVNKFHEERKRSLEATLDIEQWTTVDEVPADLQRLITSLVDDERTINDTLPANYHQLNRNSRRMQFTLGGFFTSAKQPNHSRASSDATVSIMLDSNSNESQQSKNETNIAAPFRDTSKFSMPPTSKTFSRVSSAPNEVAASTSMVPVDKVSHVIADGTTYAVVISVMSLIKTLMDYCKCAQDIRSLSADLLERLFKILQLYNSKTYHLVYSAGAVQVAGLKNITTRSLIVSQRSLKLILLLMPSIKKHFAQLTPDSNRLKRFDEIRLSYEDHAAKIPERVNSIVEDVINSQLKDWEAKPPAPSEQFNAIAQHLIRLHNSIEDALPADELRSLFHQISETFKDILIQHLVRLDISNDAGPQQWQVMQELTFYKISLNKLSAFNGHEVNFDDIWLRLDNLDLSNLTST